MTNYKITKQEGNMVQVTNTKSGMTKKGTLFANGTKALLEYGKMGNKVITKVVKVA